MKEFEIKHKIARAIAERQMTIKGINDATDTIYKILQEQLTLTDVSQQRELLLAYNEEINQCMVDSQDILEESDVDEFLANNCG